MDPYRYKQDTTHRRQGLKKKLILSILLVGILPLIMGQIMAFYKGRKEILQVNGANFQALAEETARSLDLILLEEEAQAQRIAAEPEIIQALEERRDFLGTLDSQAVKAQLRRDQEAWSTREPAVVSQMTQGPLATILHQYYLRAFQKSGKTTASLPRSSTRALFVTDIEGQLVASLNASVGFAHKHTPWWQGAFHNGVGKPYVGPVAFDTALDTYTFTLSIPILDSIRYQAVGVLHRVYDVQEFFSPSISTIQFGETGHVMLLDNQGTVIHCPVLDTGTRLPLPDLLPLLPSHPSGWTPTTSDGHYGNQSSIIGFASLPGINRITTDSAQPSWHTFVWQHPDELFGPIQHLQLWNGIFGVIAIMLLVTLGTLAAERIVTPIRRLQHAARSIGKGEFNEPLQILTGDEIQELAEEVNRMNQQLARAMGGLRSEVESKTQAMVELQESTTRILDNVPTPVILFDSAERVTYLNQAGREALDWQSKSIQDVTVFELLPVSEAVQTRLREEMHTPSQDTMAHSVAKGAPSPSFLRDPLSPHTSQPEERHQNTLEIHERLFWYDWFFITSQSSGQREVGLVLRDATEERHIQDQVAINEKLSSLGILSSGIGHELNNPLVGVIGLGEAIQEEENLEQARSYAKQIVQQGQRMATVIRDFTGQIGGKAKGQVQQVSVTDELAKAWELVTDTLDTGSVTIGTSYQCTAPIQAQPDEIRQIFVNVLTNSVQAMNGKGSLFFSTHCSEEAITISILDSGPGIPKDHCSKVFDPFFTTKSQGEGSGLGLTIARRIITRYHGAIQMKSDEGHGTLCLISFPIAGKVTREEVHHANMAQT